MNPHRVRQAHEIAATLPVVLYRQPRAVLPWRATAVVPVETAVAYARVTAPGFTRDHAERRCRRQVVRELLRGWW